MNEAIILELAQQYILNRQVDIVLHGKIGKNRDNQVEVIFLNPIALDPETKLIFTREPLKPQVTPR